MNARRAGLERAATRPLRPTEADKPLDLGNGEVVGSVTPDGRLTAVGSPLGTHGVVFCEGADAFPDEARYDVAAVRAFRARLAEPTAPGLGLAPPGGWRTESVELVQGAVPRARLAGPSGTATVTSWAPVRGAAVAQHWQWRGEPVACTWGGPAHLRRAALTQLTEGGVHPSPEVETTVTVADEGLCLRAPGLGIAVWIDGLPHLTAAAWADGRLSVPVELTDGDELTVRLGLGADLAVAREAARAATAASLDERAESYRSAVSSARTTAAPSVFGETARPVLERAAWYAESCCCLPVGEAVCVITDHRILPLCWTRDAYYVATAMVAAAPEAEHLVARYLRWLFEVAERPDGAWARSYLPSGGVKDPAFQLDQQCYPWLQLAEHAARTGETRLLERYLPSLEATLAQLERRRHPDAALFASDETPADDPLAYPYHASSHVLLWHTLERLGEVAGRSDLRAMAAEVREAALGHLVVGDEEPRMLAYAADPDGGADRYHDANDLPLALAPLWGFCAADDPSWLATMAFAFSPANPGYAPGPFGGLGSRHTPGAWPLGDVQEILWATATGRVTRARAVVERLAATAMWDGSLPEARDAQDGRVISRHWFAWPGAAVLLAAREWVPRLLPD